MTAEYIHKCAQACVRVYGTREPEKIFEMRGIKIKRRVPAGLSGMVCVKDTKLAVYVGDSLTPSVRSMISAKLLGHTVLHRESLAAGESFEYISAVGSEGIKFSEASLFAADLLIPDEKITELSGFGFTEGQIAASFGSLRLLASPKIYAMRCRGVPVCGGVSPHGGFLKKCDIEDIL